MVTKLIAVEAVKTAAGISNQTRRESGKLSVELFSFDFVNLGMKLLFWS